MNVRLTRRGAGTLVAACALFALGQVAGYPLLLGVSAAALGSVVAALGVAARRPRVEVVRTLYPDRVERGRPAAVTLQIINPGPRRQPSFTVTDKVGDTYLTVEVRSLAPGGQPDIRHNEIPTDRRGRHQIGPLTMSRTDALGLCSSRRSLGDTALLWVLPRTHPVRVVPAGRPRHHHEGAAVSLRGSLDLREVREYVVGDEVRHLHWKATAKTGRLMIRDYADPNQPRFTVLLDNRREMSASSFEEAVELAASLTVSAAKSDHRCRLVTPSGVDVVTPPGVPSARRLQEELCVLSQSSETSLVPQRLSGGGTLVVVTSVVTPADRAALAGLRFSDMIVVVIGASAPVLPGVKVLRATDAVDATRRWHAVIAR